MTTTPWGVSCTSVGRVETPICSARWLVTTTCDTSLAAAGSAWAAAGARAPPRTKPAVASSALRDPAGRRSDTIENIERP